MITLETVIPSHSSLEDTAVGRVFQTATDKARAPTDICMQPLAYGVCTLLLGTNSNMDVIIPRLT